MTSNGRIVTAQHRDFEITVFTCRKADGTWTAEAAIRHDMDGASQPMPLLEGPSAEFPSAGEARDYALDASAEWLDEHCPARPTTRSSGEPLAEPGSAFLGDSSETTRSPRCEGSRLADNAGRRRKIYTAHS